MVGIEPTTYGLPARQSRLSDSNRRPLLYESIALPTELRRLRLRRAGKTIALPGFGCHRQSRTRLRLLGCKQLHPHGRRRPN